MKIVRAGFYILSIGGLLSLFAGVLWLTWNHVLVESFNYSSMNYLEAVGLVSVAYVVYSGIRFAQISEENTEEKMVQKKQQFQQTPIVNSTSTSSPTTNSTSIPPTTVSNLSPEQRQQLRQELARCCGKPYDCADTKQQAVDEKNLQPAMAEKETL